MIVTIGDIHFQSLRPWSVQVGNRVVQDLINHPLNTPDNTWVFLGDLTERAELDGAVFAMLMTLFAGMRCKRVIILRGNHDGKVVDGKVVATFDFLKDPSAKELFSVPIEIIEEPAIRTIEAVNCLFLPHLFSDGVHNLDQYEAGGKYEPILSSQQFDVVFGHFTNTMRSEPGRKYNVEYIKTLYWCFGHNHNPGPGYQGSHIPNTIAEANQTRQIRTYAMEGPRLIENIFPATRVLDYYNVKFPEPLPKVDAEIPVWTVSDCNDEAVARQHYGDVFIRRVIYDLSLDSASFDRQNMAITNQEGETIGVKELFEAWLKTVKLDPEMEKEMREYLPLAIQ